MLSATSGFSYPASAEKSTAGFVVRYSTVGDLDPICLRSKMLKICDTSFFASNSNLEMLAMSSWSTSVEYTSVANCATNSGCGSDSPSPYKMVLMANNVLDTSSVAFLLASDDEDVPLLEEDEPAEREDEEGEAPKLLPPFVVVRGETDSSLAITSRRWRTSSCGVRALDLNMKFIVVCVDRLDDGRRWVDNDNNTAKITRVLLLSNKAPEFQSGALTHFNPSGA